MYYKMISTTKSSRLPWLLWSRPGKRMVMLHYSKRYMLSVTPAYRSTLTWRTVIVSGLVQFLSKHFCHRRHSSRSTMAALSQRRCEYQGKVSTFLLVCWGRRAIILPPMQRLVVWDERWAVPTSVFHSCFILPPKYSANSGIKHSLLLIR